MSATAAKSGYGAGAKILSIGIASTGVVTFAYFSVASYALNDIDYKAISLLWSVLFVIVSVIYRPIEQLLSRTIAERRARGFEHGHPLRTPLLLQGSFAVAALALGLALHDPLVNDDHIRVLGWASAKEINQMKELTHKVNAVLQPLFSRAGIDLVDYKLEFGHPLAEPQGPLLLGDEFTPDGCRLWDSATQEKMDKDRFRRDLGNVIGMYIEVGRRLGVSL